MNDDFITYELAKKLKEKGFDWQTFDWYDMAGNFCKGFMPRELMCREYYAPTISQVLKWLRKEKKIFLEIVIVCNGVDAEYMCDIYKIDPAIECLDSTGYLKTYEQAALAGIECVLDNLI